MNKIYLPIVFHFHQPVGNFDHVIESIYSKCYKPLLERMKNCNVKFTLHFTGYLIDWLENHHPDFIEDVKALCMQNRVELIGGGYYEPILPIIPDDCKIAQIKLLNDKIKNEFKVIPRGFWLAERVWEPQLPKFLQKCGLEYIIVDDNHLKSCGFNEDDTYYYYITEENGYHLKVFPINEKIRYISPWKPVAELKSYLEGVNEKNDGIKLILFMSDAEKMGEWATTHELCYVKGHEGEAPYVEELFKLIESTPWIKSLTISECIQELKPRSLIYLPTASYDKMEEWVLPTFTRRKLEIIREKIENDEIKDSEKLEIKRFMKGGFWRYFLVKYPESNNMHKKMLHVYRKIKACINEFGENKKVQEALIELYKSQANDSYWHGQFGGLYFNFLRHAVYVHAIKAETIVESIYKNHPENKGSTPRLYKIPFLMDGSEQIIIETSKFNMYLNPEDGGSLYELDFKELYYNLMNVLTRWKEAYHLTGNSENLIFDKCRKVALREHAVDKHLEPSEFKNNKFQSYGGFFNKRYSIENMYNGKNMVSTTLVAKSMIQDLEVIVKKEISTVDDDNLITIKYSVDCDCDRFFKNFAILIEFPLYFNGDPRYFAFITGDQKLNPLNGIAITSKFMK
ncbi:MAG: alpha-amylase/4-alpha-glucanotransferase domain-containing protein, partial [Promethearchaeota archaeon]